MDGPGDSWRIPPIKVSEWALVAAALAGRRAAQARGSGSGSAPTGLAECCVQSQPETGADKWRSGVFQVGSSSLSLGGGDLCARQNPLNALRLFRGTRRSSVGRFPPSLQPRSGVGYAASREGWMGPSAWPCGVAASHAPAERVRRARPVIGERVPHGHAPSGCSPAEPMTPSLHNPCPCNLALAAAAAASAAVAASSSAWALLALTHQQVFARPHTIILHLLPSLSPYLPPPSWHAQPYGTPPTP